MGTTYVMRPQRYSRCPITDDSGMQRFEVRDSGLLYRKLSIRDAAGTEVAVSTRSKLSGKYELLAGGQRITIRPRGLNWRKIEINSAAARLEVVGDYQSSRPFSITRGGTPTASVTFGKQLTVQVSDGEDPVFMLAVALTIAGILGDRREYQTVADQASRFP
jgi:hypothetical protein